MTLEEAINYLEVILLAPETAAYLNPPEAVKLGIEALKREKVWRQNDPGGAIHLLPGETKD